MAENTGISWTDATFNPWIGCTKVSPGCDNCYAAQQDTFRKWTPEGWGAGKPRKRTKTWGDPVKWNATPFYACRDCGWRGETDSNCPGCAAEVSTARRRVFCASLADVFDNEVDPEWRADLFHLIAATPNLDWLLLTKRIGNAWPMIARACCGTSERTRDPIAAWPWPNVWLGATIVNQEEADRDIPKLLATPARVRFLSMEPLLGPVDISAFMWPVHDSWPARYRSPAEARAAGAVVTRHRQGLVWAGRTFVNWVIVGGESGPGARPMHPDWPRSLRDQCIDAGVPFHFKQWGEWRSMLLGECRDSNPTIVSADPSRNAMSGCFHQMHVLQGMLTDAKYAWRCPVVRVGKKAAGRLLDGVEHNGFPEGQSAH